MNRLCLRLVAVLCRTLQPDEREAVCGDLAESGEPPWQALRAVTGLVVRRQVSLWKDLRPWLVLLGLAIPFAALLTLSSRRTADGNAVTIWFYLGNWSWMDVPNTAFRHLLPGSIQSVGVPLLALACWSWIVGFMVGSLARRTVLSTGSIFLFALVLFEFLGAPGWQARARDYFVNQAPFELPFYRVILPLLIQAGMVLLPAVIGMFHSCRPVALPLVTRLMLWLFLGASLFALLTENSYWWQVRIWDHYPLRYPRLPSLVPLAVAGPAVYILATARWTRRLFHTAALLVALAAIATAADPSFAKADLIPPQDRKPAPAFILKDAAGKTARLQTYRGKILLLDFWATWCHGCKQEIPWFTEFQSRFGERKFRVVGVSMDEGGWPVLKPFLASNPIPYRMLLGDEPTSHRYQIENLPDTFLIDRRGKIAAAYRGSMVDRANVESNIRALMAEH